MSLETVYIGRANVIRRTLQEDGEDLGAAEQNAITRVMVAFGPYCVDTNEATDPISYASGVVEMQLGLLSGIAEGQHDALITAFDAATPEGYAWGRFEVSIEPWPVC